MSSGNLKRGQALAMRVAKLAQGGMTSREIAALVGIKPEQVKTRRELGERLLQQLAKETQHGS